MRLIDADALITAIVKKAFDDAFLNGNTDMHRLLVQVVARQPTIDAEVVKHGKWEETVNSHCTCTACGSEWSFFENETERFDYCPHCGARMDEERKEE